MSPARLVDPRTGGDQTGPSAHRTMLERIVSIQREYVGSADAGRVWDLLLEALIDLTGSAYGFIGELDWSTGVPSLDTRAILCADGATDVTSRPEMSMLIAQVVATEAPLVLDRPPDAAAGRLGAVDGFLGLPLLASDRLVGVACVSGPEGRYPPGIVEEIEPLLLACAAIVESIQSGRERDAATARSAASAAFLGAVIESSTHGVVVVGAPSGVIESINTAGADLVGRRAVDLVGTPMTELVDEESARWCRRLFRVVGDRGLGSFQRTFPAEVDVRGRSVPLEITLSEFSIDGERRVVALVRDMSDQREAERMALRARAVLERAPDLVAWADEDGCIEYVNAGGTRMLGRAASDLAGASVAALVPAGQRTRLLDDIIPAATTDGVWSGEVTFEGSDGELPVWLVVVGDQGADHPSLAFLARDLREREEIERLKASFVANVSHELRTPLTSVLGYVELLADGAFGELEEAQEEALGIVHKNGERLLALIGDLLRITSFDTGNRGASDRVDLAAVVTGVVDRLRTTDLDRVIRIEVPDTRVEIQGDRSEMEAMVANLVGNAVKFSHAGAEVSISVESEGDWAVLSVSDEGIGMSDEDLAHLFERFHRGEEARRLEIQGTGLGLAIVEEVVRRHDGSIEVDSTVGVGSTFTVTVPTCERNL